MPSQSKLQASATPIPYGRQWLDDDDIQAVVQSLQSDWLTQGPLVAQFERALADYCGARYAVAVANGTAALHLAALAADFGPGDEIITSPNTFVASANCVIYTGARPVLADIDPATYCLDPSEVERRLTGSTKGIIPVHFAGQPCRMDAIARLANAHDLTVIEDAAHAIGATYEIDGNTFRVGGCAHSDMTIFSFHPVKHVTTGEGGAITTNDSALYHRLMLLRTHGITRDPALLSRQDGPWYYEMQDLGYNYRLTDFQCALGLKQLEKLDSFVERRRAIARRYDEAFGQLAEIVVPYQAPNTRSSYHLYVLQFKTIDRLAAFNHLKNLQLGVNVHYIPVHLQPYYARNFGYLPGDFPHAEAYYSRVVSLPLYPRMSDDEVQYVIDAIRDTVEQFAP